MRNVMNVFKILFDLRNKSQPIETAKMNPISYEFILSLLLSTHGSPDDLNWIDFNAKINELI